jgi:hypothetical protein
MAWGGAATEQFARETEPCDSPHESNANPLAPQAYIYVHMRDTPVA